MVNRFIAKIKAYSSTLITLFDQAVVSGGNFLIGILLARLLGIDNYGVFALLWMVVLFGKSMNQAFITKPMLSLAPKKEADEQTIYIGILHSLEIGTAILMTILVSIFLLLGQYFDIAVPSTSLYWVVPLIVGLHMIYEFYRKIMFVLQDIIWALVLDIVMYIGQFGAFGYLYFQRELSISTALMGIGLAHTIVCIVGFIKLSNISFDIEELKNTIHHHYTYAKWLIGTALLQWFSANFFIVVAGWLISPAAVGAVRIVQNVMGLTHVLFLAMENIVPVKAALHYKEGGWIQLVTYLKYITRRAGVVVLGILAFIAIFRTPIIEFLYGTAYVEYSYLVIGFCLTYVLVFIGHPLRFALRTLEITKPIFIAYIFGAAFSVVLAYPLIYYFDLIGLLIGIFVTQGLSQLVYLYYLQGISPDSYRN